jgi:hypothetical protein
LSPERVVRRGPWELVQEMIDRLELKAVRGREVKPKPKNPKTANRKP